MGHGSVVEVTVPVDASGDYDGVVDVPAGYLQAIIYTKDDYADTVDIAITGKVSGQNLWTEANVTASKTVHPRAPASDQAGVAMLYAAAGEAIAAKLFVAEQIRIVLAQGGVSKNGSFTFIVGS